MIYFAMDGELKKETNGGKSPPRGDLVVVFKGAASRVGFFHGYGDVFENILQHHGFPRVVSIEEKGAVGKSLRNRNGGIRFIPGIVVYGRAPNGGAALLSPRLEISDFEETGIFSPLGRVDSFGSGCWEVAGREFLVAGRDSFRYDFGPNIFASFLFFDTHGRKASTGSFQIDLLGEPCIVNRFEGVLPDGISIDERGILEVSGRDTWEFDAAQRTLFLRLPVSEFRKVRSNGSLIPGERNRIKIPMEPQGYPIVLSSNETGAKRRDEKNLGALIAYAARR